MHTNPRGFSFSTMIFLAACSGALRAPQAQPPAARRVDLHATAVSALVGVWHGQAIGTPFGDFPFAIAFDREPSGDVHGRLDGGRGMYLDFVFRQQDGRWLLIETGALPDVGVQTKTLTPVDGKPRWSDGEPAHLAVDLEVDAEHLVMTTTLRGEAHAVFRLMRARGEAAEQIRHAIARGPRAAAE